MTKKEKSILMNDQEINDCIKDLANTIILKQEKIKSTEIIGVRTRGVIIAKRLITEINRVIGYKPELGQIDTRPFRDDLDYNGVNETDIPSNIDKKDVILVDDVIYTGRTMRAAMDALMEYGRPQSIRICVLIDRGHREYPIQADYVGRVIPTSSKETIRLNVKEIDNGPDMVVVI